MSTFKGICMICMLAAAVSLPSWNGGAELVTKKSTGTINWTGGYILARGNASMHINDNGVPTDRETGGVISINRARLYSSREAREMALQNIMILLRDIRVDSENRVIDLIERDEDVSRKIAESLTRDVNFRERPRGFNTILCEARLGLGIVLSALPRTFPGRNFPFQENEPLQTRYTSLIINCSGLDVQPMLLPSVYAEDGLEIYGIQYVSSPYAARYGLVSYCTGDEEARRHQKAGDTPYYTRAVKSLRGCPVISEEDVRKVLSHQFTRSNLKKCRVIIIL